jgi:hypothetical protein
MLMLAETGTEKRIEFMQTTQEAAALIIIYGPTLLVACGAEQPSSCV